MQMSLNKSKLKTTFKPMIALDKNRNFYTCAWKQISLQKGLNTAQTTFSKRPKSEKVYFNKTHLANTANN